jgi:alkanesulfonate monooxygenase SsuD/methylene tetrahydromethanopterin reductase-like flavin-dependent oxidoreductase (luciferase family)
MRLGVGVGWQEAEYEALGEDYSRRGVQMDESIALLRDCWGADRIERRGERFHANVIAMEPKPPQGGRLPIWVGGSVPAAFRRAGELGDGWMGSVVGDDAQMRVVIDEIRGHAERAGRDPMAIGLQAMLATPPREAGGKTFYADHDRVVRRAEEVAAMGFGWLALNATAIFQSGARSVQGIIEQLGLLHSRLRDAVG